MAFFNQREVMRADLLHPFTKGITHAKLPQILLKSDLIGIEESHGFGIGAEII